MRMIQTKTWYGADHRKEFFLLTTIRRLQLDAAHARSMTITGGREQKTGGPPRLNAAILTACLISSKPEDLPKTRHGRWPTV
jgi:hypothetical protein